MFRRRTDGKIETLRGVAGLSTLADEELSRLASIADLVEVPDGTVLAREGRRGREAFLIVSGQARVAHGDDEIARLGTGQFVGEMALLEREPRSADVTTVGATRLLVFHPSAFNEMLRSAPGLTRRLLAQVSSRLRSLDGEAAQRIAQG